MAKKVDLNDGTIPVQTAEEKAEAFRIRKLEASKRMIARKKEATEKLIALALRIGTEEEKSAARYLSGELRVKGPETDKVMDYFLKEGTVHEIELFKTFKMGRAEMRKFMKKHPEVTFDLKECVYILNK